MYKRDDKARFLVLYGVILLVLGLCVMLVAAKVTNNKILANNQGKIQDALKNIEENEKDIFENTIYSSEIESGYNFLSLTDAEKEEINIKISNDSSVFYMIQSKEVSNKYDVLEFNNGKFNNEEKLKVVLSLSKDIEELDDLKIVEISSILFDSMIDGDELLKYEGNKENLIISNQYDRILKIKKVYRNYETLKYDIYIDEVYPNNPELYDNYTSPSFVDYLEDEVIYTYKLSVDNNYKYISLERYKF